MKSFKSKMTSIIKKGKQETIAAAVALNSTRAAQRLNQTLNFGGKNNFVQYAMDDEALSFESKPIELEEDQDMKEVISILQQQLSLKSKEIAELQQRLAKQKEELNVKDSIAFMQTEFQKEKDRLIIAHSKTKMELAEAQSQIQDLEDFIDGQKEQIVNLQ